MSFAHKKHIFELIWPVDEEHRIIEWFELARTLKIT